MIQKFDEFINEAKLNKYPQAGETVKGVDGEQYKVIEYAVISDLSSTNTLLRKYDSSGAMRQGIDSGDIPRNTILVALEASDGTHSVWQWSDYWLKK